MNQKFSNKIAIIISWPREIDMYSKFLDLNDNLAFDFIVNDIKSLEKGRNQSNKLIEELLIDKKIQYKLFTKIYRKVMYEKVISTGEICAMHVNFYSVTKHIYAITIGAILEFTKISEIISKFFGRPFTAGGIKSKIGIEWFPEKKIGNISIKFPDGADIVLKNSESKKKNESKEDLIKEFKLDPKKQTIVWMPSHILHYLEEDRNIFDWCKEISFLSKFYNFIIRPHPKTLSRNNLILEYLKKYKLNIDTDQNRSLKDMIESADLILADYGGTAFDSIYLNKKVVLLDMFDDSEFVKNIKKNDRMDIKVRENLLCMKIGTTKSQILSNIKEALSGKYQETINKNKLIYFGKAKGLNFPQLINFLKKL